MILVLDIGTRSIIGLLGTLQDDEILIQDVAIELHKKRAMYDGQIHDIEGVIEIVKNVKETLEKKAGYPLKEVSIAAAGRSLKTFKTIIERDLDENSEIDKDLVNSMEIEGIQEAQKALENNGQEQGSYYSVGHTVINYYLNDGIITNPVGHRGKQLRAEVLATFLPKVVIDSLYAVMYRIGLEVTYLTLEPIAAIEVAIPENMRLLNIALVDIGAGTCDIALTKRGTVTAFGMTSTAGDEITEELARKYLLDFDTAERVKCNLFRKEDQSFEDIVGINHKIDSEIILDQIQPSIENVAKQIADNILQQNGKAPNAVFLIGGGSQIPRLNVLVAEYLGLPKERVAVRGIDKVENLEDKTSLLKGPDSITPLGILLKSLKNKFSDFIDVRVDGKKIRMLKTKELKVRDALAMTNFNPRKLVPSKGKSLKVYFNNKGKVFFGKYGEPAKITMNEENCSLDSPIKNGDHIKILPATHGEDARISLGEALSTDEGFLVNGKKIFRYNNIRANEKDMPSSYILQQEDRITYIFINTVEDLCEFLEISFEENDFYNGEEKLNYYHILENGAEITIQRKTKKTIEVKNEKKQTNKIDILYNGEPLQIVTSKENLIFVDIFDYIDFDRTRVQGKLVLKHNGELASYADPLREGDEIWVYWE